MGKRRPVPTPAGHQQCHGCLVIKPLEDFEPSRDRACGIAARCRPCLKEFREDRVACREIVEQSAARIYELQYRSTPAIGPPLEPRLPSITKTAEHFRAIDAIRRRQRLQRGG